MASLQVFQGWRCERRFPFHGRATLHLGCREWPARLLDVSRHGALLWVAEPGCVRCGDACALVIPVVVGAEAVRSTARIAYLQDRIVGVRCDPPDRSSLVALGRLVEMNLGYPRLLDRDLGALLRGIDATAAFRELPAGLTVCQTPGSMPDARGADCVF